MFCFVLTSESDDEPAPAPKKAAKAPAKKEESSEEDSDDDSDEGVSFLFKAVVCMHVNKLD